MSETSNAIVYDLESKKTFAEVGGHNQQAQLEVSFLGLYSYTQNKYFSFFEKDLPRLEQILLAEKPTIIGFNSISFDNAVLQPYFRQLQMNSLPQVDILADIFRTLGFRMKLESVAQCTLGEGKSGSGLDAIRYYREGNFTALEKYCLDDVRITKDIYDYGCRHGYILYSSGGESRHMPVSWSNQTPITELLQKAYTDHLKVKLQYLLITETSRSIIDTEADILSLTNTAITVYSYATNSKQVYLIDRILSAELLQQTSAYQASLL